MNTDFQKVGHTGSSGMSAYVHYRGVADQHEVGVTSLRSRACDVMEPNYWYEYTSGHSPSWQPRFFVLLTLAWGFVKIYQANARVPIVVEQFWPTLHPFIK